MASHRYSVTPQPVETLLTWVKSGEIAIPEIQRPFVWDATKVRNLLDSLYSGYPVGYLIAWRNPTVKLKDGSSSAGKRILIDGQQRVTALMAALLGRQIVNKDYKKTRIRIAFHPLEEKFEVTNPAIMKDVAWIPDVVPVFSPEPGLFRLVNDYCLANPEAVQEKVFGALERLKNIVHNHVGLIELAPELSIETVTEIFIRVNSAGSSLSQADFAMSKIASDEAHGGNTLRKAIDYFCHMAVAPEFYETIRDNDPDFAATDYFQSMSWLKRENDDTYDPAYTDMLRVAFATEFQRGRLQDLVALLSGRNFETKQYEEAIADDAYQRLQRGVRMFMNETNFQRFVMIVRSAGFVDPSMIGSQNALNFAYILFLMLRSEAANPGVIESAVRRWLVMSLLRGRYTGSPESTIDYDMRQIQAHGFWKYGETAMAGELSDSYWSTLLPQEMDTSGSTSPYFRVFQAAQVKLGDRGFLSKDIKVLDLILNKCDVHHLYPRNYLKGQGLTRGRYNQIGNFALAQSEINIAIGDRPPGAYFRELREQCESKRFRYGAICNLDDLRQNLAENAVPLEELEAGQMEYDAFLQARRALMANKVRDYFRIL